MRRIFSETVSGNKVGLRASFSQHAERSDRHGQDRRLGYFGKFQLLFRSVKAELRELVAEGFVSLFERLTCDRVVGGQFLAHADDLRTLSGEEESDRGCCAHRRFEISESGRFL